jgi:hypothetical protein
MLIPIGFFGGGGSAGDYEQIATAFGTGSSGTISFTSIPQGYKHLQIRAVGRNSQSGSSDRLAIRFNSQTGYTYSCHRLVGNGSTVTSAANTTTDAIDAGYITGPSSGADRFGVQIVDILDYSSTTKNKTIRSLSGAVDPGVSGSFVSLHSGMFYGNQNAVTSIQLTTLNVLNWTTTSRFSLYGIKG